MTAAPKPAPTPSLVSLGLTFLCVGLGFALPFDLFPEETGLGTGRAPEVLNLFCLVSWLGLSHFYFAYRGHLGAARKADFLALYLVAAALSAAALFGLRAGIGSALFSALAWIYFISHLVKAEMYFAREEDWRLYLFPLLAFAYFSAALLAPGAWVTPVTLFLGAGVSLLPLAFGGKSLLRTELRKPLFLVATFLIGETLLWGTYRPHMTPEFRDGVYTVHVALASFYHYFKSYAHMMVRGQGGLPVILAVNALVIAVGLVTQFRFGATPLIYLFGFQFFTVWVWLHQWMSDVFNWKMKRRRNRA